MSRSFRNPSSRHHSAGRSLVTLLVCLGIGYGIYTQLNKPTPPAAATTAAPRRPPVVLIYVGNDCEPCDRARTFLKQRAVRFEERNADRSPTAQRELEKLGSRIVPVIVVDGKPQYGFKEAHLDAALRGES
jgi:glutaredoxin